MTVKGVPANAGSIQEENVRDLTRDLENVMKDGVATDFEIVCDGEVIKCHRAVLKGR